MNNDVTETNKGANIKPAARKSIHSNCNSSQHSITNMGRYGLDRKRDKPAKAPDISADQGHDEVDNCMSKLAHPSSSLSINRDKHKRNSIDLSNQDYTDSSNEDEDGYYKTDHTRNSLNALTNSSPLRRQNNSGNNSQYSFSNETSSSEPSLRHQEQRSQSRIETGLTGSKIFVILSILLAICFGYTKLRAVNDTVYDELSFHNDIKEVGAKYKIINDSILRIQSGIEMIHKQQDTGSFIFVYNSRIHNFNLEKVDNFASDVASTTSKYLRNNTNVVHVVLDSSDFSKRQSYSELINVEYREEVNKTGVMLVKELHKVPSNIAMAFHYYCDEYNPLIKKSAIFFTLDVAQCSNVSDPEATHENLENCMSEKWKTLPHDLIAPLLSRVINVVIDVSSIL